MTGKSQNAAVGGNAPNGEQSKEARVPAAVGAGPGNQLQENEVQASAPATNQDDVKPGAQPDGTTSMGTSGSRNQGIEQINEADNSSGIE